MRAGVDRTTGRVLTGWDHCAQSICIILSTAIGTRVMRRDFGSAELAMIDRPMTPTEVMRHFVAIATALRRWEPGYRLSRIGVVRLESGGVAGFSVTGDYYPRGHLADYSVVERGRMAEAVLA